MAMQVFKLKDEEIDAVHIILNEFITVTAKSSNMRVDPSLLLQARNISRRMDEYFGLDSDIDEYEDIDIEGEEL